MEVREVDHSGDPGDFGIFHRETGFNHLVQKFSGCGVTLCVALVSIGKKSSVNFRRSVSLVAVNVKDTGALFVMAASLNSEVGEGFQFAGAFSH
jgi:hypothetical protein